jgi:hypothetical protein
LVVRPSGTNIAIGVRSASPESGNKRSWAWLRVPSHTPHADVVGTALRDAYQTAHTDREGTWVPLHIPSGVAGAAMIAAVTQQIENVLTVIREMPTTL